ncbi:MAG TPA: hypothetical protein ENI86_11690, partial [Acidimicrobiales bacterium]|nr:hypothetical protein [Acidimicrobiales bacterium]
MIHNRFPRVPTLAGRLPAVLIALVLIASACSGGVDDRDVLATVSGTDITTAQVREGVQVRRDSGQFGAPGPDIEVGSDEVAGVLTNLVILQAITPAVEEMGITPPAVTGAGTSDEGVAIGAMFDEIRGHLLPLDDQAALDRMVDEELASRDPRDQPVCASHILVATEEEAQAVEDRLAAGEDFADLATELSTGPSGPGGGDLGCSPPSRYVAEFADALVGLADGEVSAPVQSQFGWHVIQRRPLDEAGRQSVVDDLTAAALTDWFNTAVDSADIEIDPRAGTWVNEGGQIGVLPPTDPTRNQPDPGTDQS